MGGIVSIEMTRSDQKFPSTINYKEEIDKSVFLPPRLLVITVCTTRECSITHRLHGNNMFPGSLPPSTIGAVVCKS